MGEGLHRWPSSMATRPQPSQTNFIEDSLSLHMWAGSTSWAPQKLHFLASPQGLHKWPGSFASAPQFLHVYAMMDLFYRFGYLPMDFILSDRCECNIRPSYRMVRKVNTRTMSTKISKPHEVENGSMTWVSGRWYPLSDSIDQFKINNVNISTNGKKSRRTLRPPVFITTLIVFFVLSWRKYGLHNGNRKL